MPAYLDTGFLLTVLIPTKGSTIASRLLRDIGAPYSLNFLHQLQIENFLVGLQKSPEPAKQRAGHEANRLWHGYFAEGVFQLAAVDWDGAFRTAITWNNQHHQTPPPFLLLLHPAIAAVEAATQFLSFDPRSREVARAAGLQVFPHKL